MLKNKWCMVIFLCIIICLVSACGNENYDVNKQYIRTFHGEKWELVNSGGASRDNQPIESSEGYVLSNEYNMTLSVEWKDIITVAFGYDFTREKINCTGTFRNIDKDQIVVFYCRPIYKEYNIEKITYFDKEKKKVKDKKTTKYVSLVGPQWGWIVYDENNNIIEDTINEENNIDDNWNKQREIDIVERYILRAETEVIPIEDLQCLENEELRYIRNGIYAYCGRKFEGIELKEYYNKYDWYMPRYCRNEFDWNFFNIYQQETIYNIRNVEESRE